MSSEEFESYERDEELLEARRLKRLEMKRKRKIQQRITLGIIIVVLVFSRPAPRPECRYRNLFPHNEKDPFSEDRKM